MKNRILAILAITLIATAIPFSIIRAQRIMTGAEQTERYTDKIRGKKIAILANQTSTIGNRHIVDSLYALNMDITGIFAPEHGFRGNEGAGEVIKNNTDARTGIKIVSMYGGKNEELINSTVRNSDIVIVDIQDVGTRFYTYYITMLKLMNKCATYGKTMMILDRPNPTGHYVDGPILNMKYKSGVGALPIPIVHGMTLGELAGMINGEGWLKDGKKCQLEVITCKNYTHRSFYKLPVPPSPNLPDMTAIYLYPSICYFEGTPVSLGRGTDKPFKVYGHPAMTGPYSFTPHSMKSAPNPPCKDKLCHGYDLSGIPAGKLREMKIDLSYVIEAYNNSKLGDKFFTSFFELLVGVDYVRTMIKEGKSAEEISRMWQDDVARFKEQRRPYLLYEE